VQPRGARSVTLEVGDATAITALRTALSARGYDAQRLRSVLRAQGDNLTPRAADVPIVERLLPRGDPLSTLIRLFLIGRPAAERDLTGWTTTSSRRASRSPR